MSTSVTITVQGAQLTGLVKTLIQSAKLRGWNDWIYETDRTIDISGLGRVTVVDTEDDHGEGRWETDNHIVFKVEFEDDSVKHYKLEGTADSYGEREWHGFYEVSGKPKTVTVYERV